MPIPENIIDEVLEKTDIVAVISRYLPLKKMGRNYKAPCPFHHEKTPSFVVSPDKQIYHCFGCNAGGNVFSFLMKHDSLQFPEAVELLADQAGIKLPHDSSRGQTDAFTIQLYKANELACQFFQSHLADNKAARDYLESRGIGEAALKKFKIGCAPDGWEGLLAFAKGKGVGADILEKAGLVVPNERGSHYDRFRNRITFPILDLKERVLGFGARVMDASLPKYLNSPETAIYSKGRNLYGLNFSRDAIKKQGHALIVEGYLDFLIPYQAGIQNIIATLGTALTVDQIKLIKRFAMTVVTVYDPDAAGESASLRSLDLFISEGVNVYVAELPEGFDPDGYIRKFGAEEFGRMIKSAKNIFDYKFEKLLSRFDMNTTHGKTGIVAEMLPTIAKIDNAVSKSEMVKKLAQKLSVDEDAVKTELNKVRTSHAEKKSVITPVEVKQGVAKAEIVVLALLLEGGNYVERAMHALALEEFRNSAIRDIVAEIIAMHKENRQISPVRLMTGFGVDAEAAALISEAASVLDMLVDKGRALEDCIARMKKDNIKDRLDALQDAIRQAHARDDKDSLKGLVTEYNGLVKMNRVQ